MNVHKFVAEKGIDKAKRVLEGAPDWAVFWISRDQYHGNIISFPNMTGHYSIKLSELKQVVESVEIVDRLFGLDQAKHTMVIAKEIGYTSDYEQIKQAIADYKLVESYKSSNGQAINHYFVSSFKENETLGYLSIKQNSQVEVLDMVVVSPRCEVRNG